MRVEKDLDRPLNSTGHGHLPFLPLRKSLPRSTPLPHTETLMCALTDTHSLAPSLNERRSRPTVLRLANSIVQTLPLPPGHCLKEVRLGPKEVRPSNM